MDVQRHPLDVLMSADESFQAQITELNLLSRAEQQHHSTPRSSSSSTTNDTSTQGQTGRSALSVLLSASSTLASEGELLTPPPSPSSLQSVFSPTSTRRALMLPTLSEDDSEESTEFAPETVADSPGDTVDQGEEKVVSAVSPEADNADGDQIVAREANEECTEQCDERDEEQNDHAFQAMLEQLPQNASSLMLSVSDLTFRKLDLVREALLESSQDDPQLLQGLSAIRPLPLLHMKRVRTIIALDTIRLMLRGYPRQEVSIAITTSVRQIFNQFAQEQGIQSFAHAPVVLTTSNIARVVLIARQSLISGEYSCHGSTRETPRNQMTRVRDMTGSDRAAIPSSQSIVDGKSVKSPVRIKSSEPRRPTTTAPRQKSILASEGVHVLIQEKIAAFKYRATTGSPASGTFKIRRDSAVFVDLAAQRRFKSLAYGKEQSRSNGSTSSTY